MAPPAGRAWDVAIGRSVGWGNGRVRLRNDPAGRRIASESTAGAWNDPLGRTWAMAVAEAEASDWMEAPELAQDRNGSETERLASVTGTSWPLASPSKSEFYSIINFK